MSKDPGFIIGGGPSLRGFDFESLLGLRCMAINAAFKEVPWADCAFIGDTRLLDRLAEDDDWTRFGGDRYTRDTQLARVTKEQPKYMWPLRTQDEWSTTPGCVITLGNTGLCGINLAELLGWDPIFLLGFDADGDRGDGRMDNYHAHYPRDWAKPTAFSREKFVRIFDSVKSAVRAKVYNCNPDSELTCFPKITPEDAIQRCHDCV